MKLNKPKYTIDDAVNDTLLLAKLEKMKSNGASTHDCVKAALDFIYEQNGLTPQPSSLANSSASSGGSPPAQQLPPSHDAATCDGQAAPSDGNASACGANANPSASPSASWDWPPKLPFAPGDRLYQPALDLASHMDKRSPLDRLSLQQQNSVAKLLRDYSPVVVANLLAQPSPAGFSLQTSEASLRRFEERHRKREHLIARYEFHAECNHILAESGADDDAFLNGAERYLKMRLFQLAQDPSSPLSTIAELANIINGIRKQSLAEIKVCSAIEPPEPLPPEKPKENA
jgi:hypothetical protein